jgi:putative transcriptional regulator
MQNDVRRLREDRALSQGDLAKRLGVSRQTVNAIETGRYLPSLPLALAIGRYFGRPVEEVFRDETRG